jgi:hypothetical protein
MFIAWEPYKIDVDIKEDIKIIEQLFETKRLNNAANNQLKIKLNLTIETINNIDLTWI